MERPVLPSTKSPWFQYPEDLDPVLRDVRDNLDVLDSDVDDIQTGALPIPLAGIEGALGQYEPLANMRAGVVNVRDYGATAAKINEAAAEAASAGALLVGRGEFEIDETVTIACDADFTAATFLVDDNTINPAIRVGTTSSGVQVEEITVILPRLIQQDKVAAAGWVGSDVGVEIANLYSSQVTIPRVEDFLTGVRLAGYGTGCVYNNIFLGYLRNNKISLHLEPETGGWVNENVFYNGRWTIRSGEGTNISGARYIYTDGTLNTINGNYFLKPALEGDGPEYHVELIASKYNTLMWPRCEATSWKMLIDGAVSSQNVIWGATDDGAVAITETNGAQRNSVLLPTYWQLSGGGATRPTLRVQNGTSGGAAISIMANDATLASSEATAYAVAILPNFTYYKRSTDADNRIEIEHRDALINLGDGTNAPDVTFGRYAANTFGVAADDVLRTGSGVTGSRPAAATVGAGAVWFDTTIGKPIWSTGSAWVLADGTAA